MAEHRIANIPLNLQTDFPATSYETWQKAAVHLLKGASSESLCSATAEGIKRKPIYNRENAFRFLSGEQTLRWPIDHPGWDWDVAQEIPYFEPEEYNLTLREALRAGQTIACLTLPPKSRFGRTVEIESLWERGTRINSLGDLRAALDGIRLNTVPLHVRAGLATPAFVALFAKLCTELGVELHKVVGNFATDPLAELARSGSCPANSSDWLLPLSKLSPWAASEMPGMANINVDATVYHEAGANAVQELACAISSSVYYIRELSPELAIDQIAGKMQFSFSLGSDFFMEIAKLRAARLLFARVLDVYGCSTQLNRTKIHCFTSERNKSHRDIHNNILRTITEAASAILGGCDSLHVSPFDSPVGSSDQFSQRIARNVQLILANECHLGVVSDTAKGSWYIESLTNELAHKAWDLFQQIESNGGMLQALQKGLVQALIKQTADARGLAIVECKQKVIGLNAFRLKNEQADISPSNTSASEVPDKQVQMANSTLKLKPEKQISPAEWMDSLLEAAANGATLQEIMLSLYREAGPAIEIEPLVPRRYAIEYEKAKATTGQEVRP